MTTIAILGATGHIGKALAAELNGDPNTELLLYARRPNAVVGGLDITEFGERPFDVVINAVGAGDPGRLKKIGSGIIELTEQIDNFVLRALENDPRALLLSLSSGAVYGTEFFSPAATQTKIEIAPNDIMEKNFYAIAKLYSEVKHRALSKFNIIDLRVFSFFSRYLDLDGQFFMADLARSLMNKQTFETMPDEMVRDYTVPEDFAQLIRCCIQKWQSSRSPINTAIDVYSREPTGKFDLIDHLENEFGLICQISEQLNSPATGGQKSMYCSNFNKAEEWGFRPRYDSIEGIAAELTMLLETR
jgi:nucleoside-diphosphate-sugar epimerase